MKNPLLEIKDLSIAFIKKNNQKQLLFDKFSISIRDGELIVIIGASGSGKSSLLNAVAGFYRPNDIKNKFIGFFEKETEQIEVCGEILLNGKTIINLSPFEREVGLVMQRIYLYDHLTARENILLPLKFITNNKQYSKNEIDSIADELKIKNKLDENIKTLSGGELQRVALAKLLMRKPKIALLDEAFSNLDPRLREDLRSSIFNRLLKNTGTCALFVTHHFDDAFMANQIVVLYQKEPNTFPTLHEIFTGQNPGEAYEKMKLTKNLIIQKFVVIK